jgi:hypothetical protein
MTDVRATIVCSGFVVDDPSLDYHDVQAVAYDLASDIGMRLAGLGRGSQHGSVILTVGNVQAASDDENDAKAPE